MVRHVVNPSTWETEAGRFLCFQGQSGFHKYKVSLVFIAQVSLVFISKYRASQRCIVKTFLKKKTLGNVNNLSHGDISALRGSG